LRSHKAIEIPKGDFHKISFNHLVQNSGKSASKAVDEAKDWVPEGYFSSTPLISFLLSASTECSFTDEHGWASSFCTFPDYIHRRTWTDLSGKHRYTVSEDGTSLEAVHLRHSAKKSRVSLSYKCLTTFPNDPDVFEASSLTSHGW
jgi:hypothetical protein